MIYITGDVHEKIEGIFEHKDRDSDLDSTIKYLEILKKHKLSSTLFVNGILLKNKPEKIKELLKFNVELGGHTYDNFNNIKIVKSYIYRKIFGCVYGPTFYQRKDIKKTKKAFESLNLKMTSWRTHAFSSNDKTFEILKENGVRYVSDLLGDQRPFEKDSIIHVVINTPVDQNTIVYGKLRPDNRDPFAGCTKGRITSEEWFEILKKRVIENEKNGIPSVILIHPITMDLLDDFNLFKKIAKFLSNYESAKVSDIIL